MEEQVKKLTHDEPLKSSNSTKVAISIRYLTKMGMVSPQATNLSRKAYGGSEYEHLHFVETRLEDKI